MKSWGRGGSAGSVSEQVFNGGKRGGGQSQESKGKCPSAALSAIPTRKAPPAAARHPRPSEPCSAPRGKGQGAHDKDGCRLPIKARCRLASHPPVASLRTAATRPVSDAGVTEEEEKLGRTCLSLFKLITSFFTK